MRTSRPNLIKTIWYLVLVIAVSGAILFFAIEVISYLIPFAQAQAFVDSIAADGHVESFTFNGYQLTKRFAWVAGLLMLEILLFWIVARKKILNRLNEILAQKKEIVKESPEQVRTLSKVRLKATPLIASSLFILFYPLYMAAGLLLRNSVLFSQDDIFIFDMDAPIAIRLITGTLNSGERHPLFKLFFYPLGLFLANAAQSPIFAAVAVNALFGALCVVFMFLLLSKAGLNPEAGFLWSAILGVSTTHLVFSAFPETYIFSAFSMILLFYLSVAFPANLMLFIPAAVLSVGITTSNIIPATIAFVFSLKAKVPAPSNRLSLIIAFILAVIIILGLLNVLSILIFKSGVPSFLPWLYLDQQLSWTTLQHPTLLSQRLSYLVESFLLYNFISPKLYLPLLKLNFDLANLNLLPANYLKLVSSSESAANFTISSLVTYAGASLISAQIWLGLIFFAIFNFIRYPENRSPLVISLLLTLTFNFLLHIFFGLDIFLYSAHWTFIVLAFVALSLRRYARDLVFQLLLGLILFLFTINNLRLISDLKLIFG